MSGWIFRFCLLVLTLRCFPLMAEMNAEPESSAVDFSRATISGNQVVPTAPIEWIRDIYQHAGVFLPEEGAWLASTNLAMGQGRLTVRLNREKLAADLALTLIYDDEPDSDFIVQLWDDQDRIVALDLFSNIITAGRDARTDTFIIPFIQYPSASQVVIRRITGNVRIFGFVLSPVACEVPVNVCDARELAIQLGANLNPDNPLVQEANRIAAALEKQLEWNTSSVQQPKTLAEISEIGEQALSKPDYPAFVPSKTPVVGQLIFPTTGSALFISGESLRHLNMYHAGALGEIPGYLTSVMARDFLMDRVSPVCLMSMPMSVADRERFYRERGYHVLEVPVAIDAIQVAVNADNPLNEITIPQLDAIYGSELLAGAPAAIRTWGDIGVSGDLADQEIEVLGGALDGGTSQTFKRLVLQGGDFSPNLISRIPGYYGGLMVRVASNKHAIGYANLQHRNDHAKRLAIAKNTGLPAYPPTADAVYSGHYPLTRYLYVYVDAPSIDQMDPVVRELLNFMLSREGQTIVARAGQIPLGVDEVLRYRATLFPSP